MIPSSRGYRRPSRSSVPVSHHAGAFGTPGMPAFGSSFQHEDRGLGGGPGREEADSKPPVELDIAPTSSHGPPARLEMPIAPLERYRAMGRYFVMGLGAGALLLGALALTGEDEHPRTSAAGASDEHAVRHLTRADLNPVCFNGFVSQKDLPARLTVSARVDAAGHVRQALAAGETPALRRCVEARVRSWEFLPQPTGVQANAGSERTVVVPVEIALR